MKTRTSFLTRCLALVMALVMFATSANLGVVLQASAATAATVTTGKLVADNYELSDAEKALLSSGKLAGTETITYSIPEDTDNLVAVDSDKKTIKASAPEGWTADTAEIVVGTETVETVALTNGEGKYAYEGNAFVMKVNYSLKKEVAGQEALLGNMAKLQADIATANAVSEQSGNLSAVEAAMETMYNTIVGSDVFDAATQDAVKALNDQVSANGGKLNLTVMIDAYTSGSKTAYLQNNAAQMRDEVKSTIANITPVKNGLANAVTSLDTLLRFGIITQEYADQVTLANKLVANLYQGLEAVADDAWYSAEGALTTAGDAELDAQVAALGTLTAVTVKNPLNVATATVQANMSMVNVTVTVALKVVTDAVDSAELVSAGSKTAVVTVAEGATTAEVLAAIEANGIEAAAKAEWTAYVEGEFEASASALPETVAEDTTYTVTYAPKNYTVSLSYADDMTVPYGYKMTLPVNPDAAQAYDYVVNGEDKTQGSVITITGATEISRSAGKAYTNSDLYKIIADNNGNDYADEILTSGALNGNVAIAVRKPDPADAESLLKLEGNVLTAVAAYDAAYAGLSWAPYTYGAKGTENAFSGNTADWTGKSVKVQYILNLTNLADQAAAAQATIKTLKAEADTQIETLDKLAKYHETMGQLDKTKLGGMNGVIDVTDFSTDAAKNQELRTYFKGLVSGIINNNLNESGKLKIYDILGSYLDANSGGLNYYYANAETVINEINTLSGYLSGLLADDEKKEALGILVAGAGFPEYVEKIADLEGIMAEVKAALTAPNAAINVKSENLYKLAAALEKDGTVEFTGNATPYLLSETLTATDDSVVMVQLFVNVGNKREAFTTAEQSKGYVLTQADVDALVASAEAFAAQELGAKAPYYTVDMSALNALVGTELTEKQTNVEVTYTAKVYTVAIDGVEGVQTITIENTKITLPAHAQKGWVYTYTVFSRDPITVGQKAQDITLDVAELDQFGNGVYTITRTETQPTVETEGNKYITETQDGTLVAKVPATLEGMTGMAMELTSLGYSYIALNDSNNALLETAESTTVSLQALMDAILSDNTFCSQTLIDVHNNNGGKVFSAEMYLGNGANDIIMVKDFVFEMENSNADLGKVAKGLETIKPYLTFQAKDGVLNVKANLPEKIYEVYLTALLATGNVDKEDMNAVNDEIAYQFLYDYVDMILNSDANTTTYTNTLKTFGKDYDLTGYEDYYQMLVKALNHDGVIINDPEVEGFDMSVTAGSRAAIEKIFALIGMDMTAYSTELAMVKEYQPGQTFNVNVLATLDNLPTSYEALILDLKASGESTVKTVAKKFDYTNDLPARAAKIADEAAVILLADVDGDVNFPGTTILDLNGYKINGNVTANGTLFVVDSRLNTYTTGEVTGSVSATGAMHITGGKFGTDVTAYLKDGYKQVDGYVQNVLYTIKSEGDTATFVVNSDYLSEVEGYLPHVQTLAVDIAVDVALNYFTAAAMNVDGNYLYTVDFDQLVNLLKNEGKIDGVLDRSVDSLNHEGITAFANAIIADLLDFGGIADGIKNGTPVAAYEVAVNPWQVVVEHVTDRDVLDITLTANSEIEKALNIELVVSGSNIQKLVSRLEELEKIVVVKNVTVGLDDPDYIRDENTVNVSGNAKAEVVIDLTQNPEYLNVMAVYMASVSDEKTKADLITAVEHDYYDVIKGCFDSTTANEIFKGLKDLTRTETFVQFANRLGFEGILSDETIRIGNLFHLLMTGAGKALDVLEIAGPNAEMAGLVEDGTYTLNRTFTHNKLDGKPSYRGYAVNYDFNDIELSLTVKVFGPTIIRIWGADRSHTALEIAEKMKNTLNVEKFNTIVLASGSDFPDALSGSFLAIKEDAPILLYRKWYMDDTVNYIVKNLNAGGKVYILGGNAAVPAEMEAALNEKGVATERVKGANRWATNLEVLRKGNAAAETELIVTNGWNYADVMTASSTGLPIMIVNSPCKEKPEASNVLTAEQKAFLKGFSGKITIFGGTAAVSEELENEIEAITGVEIERVKGVNREATGLAAANKYYNNPDTAMVAYSDNFPDGLCGGPLAHTVGAPLLLVKGIGTRGSQDQQYKFAADYVDANDITIGYVLGGEAAVSDETAKAVFNDATIIKHRFEAEK